MNRQQLMDLCGWCGAVVLLVAYALFGMSVLEAGLLYHGLNFAGSVGVGVAAFAKKNYPAAFLEVAWASIAAAILVYLLFWQAKKTG
jgi:hypothetical protein